MPDDKTNLDVKSGTESSTESGAKGTTESPTEEKGEQTLEQVVEDAAKASVERQSKEPLKPETKEETKPEGEDPDEEDEDALAKVKLEETKVEEQTQEDKDSELPFNTHPRFQELVKQKNEFAQQVESLKPQVERVKTLDKYCQDNGITEQEFHDALNIVALLKKDPRAARSKLNEFVETIDVTLGDRLPVDIQKKVDDGVIDLESAKELAQARLSSRNSQWQVKTSEQRHAEEQNRLKVEAITSWQASKQSSDPDFQKKFDLIQDRFVFLINTEPPQTAQQAVALAEKAYKFVNDKLGMFVPKPKAKKVLTTNGSSSHKEADDFVMKSLDDVGKVVDLIVAKHKV